MMILDDERWVAENHRRVGDAVERLRRDLETSAADATDRAAARGGWASAVPALEWLGDRLGLSRFERDVVLLAAAVELRGAVAGACALANGDERRPWPTFGLALRTSADAHWSALAADGPLRRFRLVEIEPGDGLTGARLRCAERVVHLLAGVDSPDERLAAYVTARPPYTRPLPAGQAAAVAAMIARWSDGAAPVAQLAGAAAEQRRAVADGVAVATARDRILEIDPAVLPAAGSELDDVFGRLAREAVLTDALVWIELGDRPPSDADRWTLARLGRALRTPLVISGARRAAVDQRIPIHDIEAPDLADRRRMWSSALRGTNGHQPDGRDIERLAARHVLTQEVIDSVVANVADPSDGDAVWDACRRRLRTDVDGSARVRVPVATWDRLILPDESLDLLRSLVREARHRALVDEAWGMAQVGGRGGTSALFAGPSGTGKSFAAGIIASDLGVDLLQVDLSQVVNKYIGETEKNLARVFDAGERSGSVLLFDEADALFGKRTDVKDSHDRYANIEVSYLLQRMETYAGVAILTTNLRSNLDPAFVRRLRFIVNFPHPGPEERAAIWAGVFPSTAPTGELDVASLARLDVPGGTIANIAKGAAFRAADAGQPISMAHLAAAAAAEYTKLERPLTQLEAAWT